MKLDRQVLSNKGIRLELVHDRARKREEDLKIKTKQKTIYQSITFIKPKQVEHKIQRYQFDQKVNKILIEIACRFKQEQKKICSHFNCFKLTETNQIRAKP